MERLKEALQTGLSGIVRGVPLKPVDEQSVKELQQTISKGSPHRKLDAVEELVDRSKSKRSS